MTRRRVCWDDDVGGGTEEIMMLGRKFLADKLEYDYVRPCV
jgi:hypothetical protein